MEKSRKITGFESSIVAKQRADMPRKRKPVASFIKNCAIVQQKLLEISTDFGGGTLIDQEDNDNNFKNKWNSVYIAVQTKIKNEDVSDRVKSWFTHKYYGTHMKTLYLQRFLLTVEMRNFITQRLLTLSGLLYILYTFILTSILIDPIDRLPTSSEKEFIKPLLSIMRIWDPICVDLKTKFTIPEEFDLNYVICENYKLAIGAGLRHRSKQQKLSNGVKLPIPAPIRATLKSDTHLFSDTDHELSDEEIIEFWKSQKTYVGKVIYVKLQLTTTNKNEMVEKMEMVPVRMLDIRTQMILELLNLIHKGIIKKDKPVRRLPAKDWQDGATGLKWPLMAILVSYLFDKDHFYDEEKNFCTVTQPLPIIFGVSRETVKAVQYLKCEEMKMVANRLAKPFLYEGVEYYIDLKVNSCDHGNEGKANDSQCGGNLRCGKCAASWHKDNKYKLWDFHEMLDKTYQKSFKSNSQLYESNSQKAQEFGIKRIHPLYQETEGGQKYNMDSYQLACDAMHDIGGHGRCLLNLERNTKTWDDKKFMVSLTKTFNRTSIVDLRIADLRLLFVLYKDIILPAQTDIQREKLLGKYLDNLTELQWIAYQPPSAQKNRQLRLRLHCNLFSQFLLAKNLYGDAIMDVYFHDMVFHWGKFFEEYAFSNVTTEQGENWLSSVKRILKTCCLHEQKSALTEVLVRLHTEKIVNNQIGAKQVQHNRSRVGKIFNINHTWKEFSISKNDINESDYNTFFRHLGSFNYSKDVDWTETESSIVFNTLPGINQYLENNGVKGIFDNTAFLELKELPVSENELSILDSRNEIISEKDLEGYTCKELKEMLRSRNLPLGGKKIDLINRIIAYERTERNLCTEALETDIIEKDITKRKIGHKELDNNNKRRKTKKNQTKSTKRKAKDYPKKPQSNQRPRKKSRRKRK